jgi:hypothetical protein
MQALAQLVGVTTVGEAMALARDVALHQRE